MKRLHVQGWYRAGLAMLAMTVVLHSPAWAGVIRSDVADSLYQNLAADARYESVGRITLAADDGNNYAASGSLISSKWVLTAAHVVADALSINFIIDGQSFSAASWVAHPNYNGGDFSYDLGLIELSAAPAITPATRYTGNSELGKVGTFVGYGMTGTGDSGAQTYDATKRAGENVIDVAFVDTGGRRNWRVFGSDFDSPLTDTSLWGSNLPLGLEYLISFGDSGGGVFIEDKGKTYLAGVHSFGVDYNADGLWSDYGDYTGHVRVSAFNDWIDSVIAGTGGTGGTGGGKDNPNKGGKKNVAATVAVVPEPATISLLGLALAAVARRRTR